MKKAILGFVVGLVALVVVFCLVVLIWGSVESMTFGEVIQSWFNAKEPVEETIRLILR